MRRKLAARGFPERLIADALDALEAENLLSDRRFTENFVTQRIARGHGPVKIRYDLRERGVDDDVATSCIDGDRQAWCDRALAVRHKRFGNGAPEDIRDRSRQTRFLEQRGFETEHIRFALDDLLT